MQALSLLPHFCNLFISSSICFFLINIFFILFHPPIGLRNISILQFFKFNRKYLSFIFYLFWHILCNKCLKERHSLIRINLRLFIEFDLTEFHFNKIYFLHFFTSARIPNLISIYSLFDNSNHAF
jgi:hypothetical protein